MITFQNSARVDYPQSHKDRRNLFTQNCFIARYRSDFSVFKLLWTTTYCAISFMSTDFSHSNVMCLYFLHMNYLCTIFKQSEWMKSFDVRVSFFSPFIDEQSRLFNANCRNDVLLQHIKKRCDCHREGKTKHPKIMSKPEVTKYPATLVLFNIDTDPLPTESQLHNLQFYICLNRWL